MVLAITRIQGILAAAFLLLTVTEAFARPLLVAPQRPRLPSLVQEEYPGQYPTYYAHPVIDGDTMLVNASRVINANYERREGVYLFQRSASGQWNYVRPLIENILYPATALINGDLALVQTYTIVYIYERSAQGWAQTDMLEVDAGEWVESNYIFRIDDGSLYVRPEIYAFPSLECQGPIQKWSRVNGIWTAVATIGPERCSQNAADVNEGRALLVRHPTDEPYIQGPADIHAATSATSWPLVAQLPPPPPNPPYLNLFGTTASLSGDTAYIDIGYLFRDDGGNNWRSIGRLREPEAELDIGSQRGQLRGNNLVLWGHEPDYELPSMDWEVSHDYRTLRVYRKQANGQFGYHAKLSADQDIWNWALSEDGRRVVAAGPSNINGYDPVTELYVFEIPDTVSFKGTQQDTFEANNFSRWTATAGQFAVTTRGATRVLRQDSLAGESGAHLTAIDWADQSIEADLRPLEFQANGRWFGLVTRRTDALNYYYVTFRSPGVISLRKMSNGTFSELAATALRGGFTVGRNYRVRLESVGDKHVVYVDGIPRLRAKDTTLTHGHPGVAGYRTRFEADNVTVSNATRQLLRLDSWERHWASGWYTLGRGSWQLAGDEEDDIYVLKQTDASTDVRWFSTTAVGNQVVSARVRPASFVATSASQDPWVGIAAQVKDDRNYYYITLRSSNQLSLRRLVNGTVQVLATVPQQVSTGVFYNLRLEIVGTNIRAFVNGDLKIQFSEPTMSGVGRNGMLMYRAAADWESYIAYQP